MSWLAAVAPPRRPRIAASVPHQRPQRLRPVRLAHDLDDSQMWVDFQRMRLKGVRNLRGVRDHEPGSLSAVRLTEFWQRMDEQFGSVYAQSVAKDYVLDGLGGRTVMQALADGEDAKTIWRAVCSAFNVPERLR